MYIHNYVHVNNIYIIKLHLQCLVPLQLWQGSYEPYRVSFHGDLCHLGIYLVSAKLSYHTHSIILLALGQ